MANYTITHRCGHEGMTNVTGAPEKREIKLSEQRAWFAERDCPNCQIKAEIAAARDAGNDELAEQLIHERNRRNGRKGAKALQNKYGVDAADRIAQKFGFASHLQR